MEIGMAAKDDGQIAREEGDQRIVDLALQAVYRGTGKRTWIGKGCQGGKYGRKNPWQKGSGKKGSQILKVKKPRRKCSV